MSSLDQRLDNFAEIAIKVGLGLLPGQELVMTAPVEAIPLARKIAEQAYKAGASLVTTIYADDAATLASARITRISMKAGPRSRLVPMGEG